MLIGGNPLTRTDEGQVAKNAGNIASDFDVKLCAATHSQVQKLRYCDSVVSLATLSREMISKNRSIANWLFPPQPSCASRAKKRIKWKTTGPEPTQFTIELLTHHLEHSFGAGPCTHTFDCAHSLRDLAPNTLWPYYTLSVLLGQNDQTKATEILFKRCSQGQLSSS